MKTQSASRLFRYAGLMAVVMLLTSCSPTASTPTEAADQPVSTEQDAALETPNATMPSVALDYARLAREVTVETVPAQSASPDAPYWAYAPEHTVITLQGYPVANHLHQAQIFIYPLADLASFNEGMGRIAEDLQGLLGSHNPAASLPFLPLYNAGQVIHSQVRFFDFNSGTGVRYLTQFDQGILPINNYELIYTYQGITSDGQYYVAAVLPVTHPALPDDDTVNEDLIDDFQGYLASVVANLNQQPVNSFSPDLNVLDVMIQSIEV